jgi:transposase
MGAARLREGERAAQLRAGSCRKGRQSGAPIAVAGGYPQSRTKAARIGGMDRQTLRDWVHAHNERGFEGRIDAASGRPPKLSTHHKAEINALIEKGPDPKTDGVVRWRRIVLARLAKERFGGEVGEDTIGRGLREFGFSHVLGSWLSSTWVWAVALS